ncbi:hypothetical protein N7462_001626 [Penicillium macrosclerotiorum]|uniref:uncharacterized protein n=1 Tax=Penicillium macrosclerotiorum TaxID=303699 RepID=UPI002547BA05|nr:uncharacterized protein N7462_001626 [Penicillium macrosclerotiorum]KAJ5692203.1 hypothetical protein N7462_001626 [Penicillium macrosclerotiorum]
MRFSVFFASALAALVAADSSTTTVGLVIPGWDFTVPYYTSTAGSVSAVDALATTYLISCLKDAPTTLCDIKDPWTLIQGPATVSYTGVYTGWISGSDGVTATEEWNCKLKSYTLSASCEVSYKATGTSYGSSYSTSFTASSSNLPTKSLSIGGMLITGGLSSLTQPAATKTPDAAPAALKPLITAAPLGAAAVIAIAGAF